MHHLHHLCTLLETDAERAPDEAELEEPELQQLYTAETRAEEGKQG